MISVVYSTRENNQYHIDLIKQTSGIHKDIEIIQYINNGEYSLTELYNKALKESKHDIVVFLHDDIYFDTKNWGKKIIHHFEKNQDYGILGVAGSTYMPKSGKWWEVPSAMRGIVNHESGGKKWESKYSTNLGKKLYEVVNVDGVFFSVHKKRIKVNFDENVKGFHFYDVSFSFANHLEGVKVGVHSDIRITHKSIGETNEQWESNREEFSKKYYDKLPITTYESSKKLNTYIVCHDQDIIESYINSDKFKYVKNLTYIFVGKGNSDKIRQHKNVIVATDYEDNLEDYPNFTAFTAWYLLWKNNLIDSDYINLLEYDVMLSDNFSITTEMVTEHNPKLIGFVPFDMRNYHFINNPNWVQTIFNGIKEVYKIDLYSSISALIAANNNKQLVWPSTSNALFEVDTFKKYMLWFNKLIPYLKGDKNAGHAFERSLTFFCLMSNTQYGFIPNVLQHIQMDSHKTQGHFVNKEEQINKLINSK